MSETRQERISAEIERAKRLGTYNKIDRSKQYEGRYSSEALLRSDNYQWQRLRRLENVRLRDGLIIACTSALLAQMPGIVKFLLRFTH